MKAFKKSTLAFFILLGWHLSNAQSIVNNSDCAYNVRVHYELASSCSITGPGLFYTVPPHSSVGLPAPSSTDWILAFSVRKTTGGPLRIVGDCSLPKVRPLGFCMGNIAKAYYQGGGNLEID